MSGFAGAIGLATVRGVADVLVLKTSVDSERYMWLTPLLIEGSRMHPQRDVKHFRPLYLADRTRQVVLDPEDLNDVARFLKLALWGWDQIRVEDYNPTDRSLLGAQGRLRRLLKKPVPPEPEGDDWVAQISGSAQYWPPDQVREYGWENLVQNFDIQIYRKESK